ncbi:MAG: protein phosphatase 2C domain-containing protein [Gammaproteobacteria bacterium]
MSEQSPFDWSSSACTDVGAVRELNEDAYLERPDLGLWLVADGMGGHFAGDVASQMVVSAMDSLAPPRSLSEFVDAVEQRLLETNRRLRDYAEREETHTIGSTVVALLVHGEHAVCLWAGDSRMYRHRAGKLEQISQDHALVEELLERGVLTPEQAVDHPHANLVTRAVGAADRLFLDVEIVPIQAGDLFILCSDGLEKEVAEEEMSVIDQAGDPSQLSHTLLARALAIGARDNVTVITVAIHGQHEAGGRDQTDVEEEADTRRHEQLPPV